MKLSKYIQDLQKLLQEHGDLELIYSSDDEGNEYNKLYSVPSISYFIDYECCVISEDELDNWPEDEYEKVICIN